MGNLSKKFKGGLSFGRFLKISEPRDVNTPVFTAAFTKWSALWCLPFAATKLVQEAKEEQPKGKIDLILRVKAVCGPVQLQWARQ